MAAQAGVLLLFNILYIQTCFLEKPKFQLLTVQLFLDAIK